MLPDLTGLTGDFSVFQLIVLISWHRTLLLWISLTAFIVSFFASCDAGWSRPNILLSFLPSFFFFFFYQGLQKCKWVCCEKHGSNTLLHILYAPGGLKSVFTEGQIRAQIATAYKKIVFLERFRFCTTTTKHGYTCGGYYYAKINNGGSRSNICSFLFKTWRHCFFLVFCWLHILIHCLYTVHVLYWI